MPRNKSGGVYPRVGGGTVLRAEGQGGVHGLSPRGRGNPYEHNCAATGFRSIPAWAGEPFTALNSAVSETVYPRVGGGTSSCISKGEKDRGLSPRGRGNPG